MKRVSKTLALAILVALVAATAVSAYAADATLETQHRRLGH